MKNKSFKEKYDRVFHENGEVKLCGRAACIELMQALEELYPEESSGDTTTGFMNVEKIHLFCNRIVKFIEKEKKMKINFEEEYSRVFDENDDIRPCGKDVCIALMLKMQEAFPGEVFGDTETGAMDIFKIKRFHRKTLD